MENQNTEWRFAICINNEGYEDDLKMRTVYQILPDQSAARSNYVRVVDETGEDYLYPAAYFVPVEVPREVEKVLLHAICRTHQEVDGAGIRQGRSLTVSKGVWKKQWRPPSCVTPFAEC